MNTHHLSRNRRLRHLRRAAQRGMTMIEILVVLAIVALISGTIAFAVIGQMGPARIKTTQQSARALRNAASTYRLDHESDCPTVEMLVKAGAIDRASKTTDAWEKPFTINCDDGDITVTSGGPDGKIETPQDNIRIPDLPPAHAEH